MAVTRMKDPDSEFLDLLLADDPIVAERSTAPHLALSDHDTALSGLPAEHALLSRCLRLWAEAREARGEERDSPGGAHAAIPWSIPGFRLLCEIGRGGIGIVYHAHETAVGRDVALKVIPRKGGTGGGKATLDRFLREVRAIARLQCPHIATLYSSGTTDQALFYAMELLDGETLEERIEHWRREPHGNRYREAAEVISKACDALELVHHEGIVHRDLKPSNIFLTSAGEVKVIDFGLARGDEDATVTQSGALVGSLAYMSPEQVKGERERVDWRADIYALGATLYEAATLHRPFEGEPEHVFIPRLLEAEPESPRKLDPNLPLDLSAVIEKAMEHELTRRYASAGAMADDLRAFLNGEPVQARPVSTVGRWGRRIHRRRKRLTAIGVVGMAILAAAIAFSIWQVRAAREQSAGLALVEARSAAENYRKLMAELPAARSRAAEAERSIPGSADFIARKPVFAAREALTRIERDALSRFDSAVIAAQRGLEIHAASAELRAFLTSFLWDRYLSVEAAGDATERRRLEAQLLSYEPAWAARLQARGRASIASDPPDAQVFLFRYEEHGLLLRPVPYHPHRGLLVPADQLPQAEMRIVHEPSSELMSSGMRLGDRVVAIAGEPVSVLGTRAFRRLVESGVGGEIELERGGERVRCTLRAGAWDKSLWLQVAWCAEADAFPLVITASAALGRTPLTRLELEAGSYLAVLRREGFRPNFPLF